MSMDLEYAIRQDIRNNPVVREVDRDQKREFYRLIGLAALIVTMLLFAAVQQFKIVSNGINIERLRQDLAAERSLQRKLRLQLESQLSPQVIESRATRELQMVAPSPDQIRVLERVPGTRPSRAVIADARQGSDR